MNEVMSEAMGELQKMQMQTLQIAIQFPLQGHTITVTGMNPYFVIKGVEEMKKNADKLSKTEEVSKETVKEKEKVKEDGKKKKKTE